MKRIISLFVYLTIGILLVGCAQTSEIDKLIERQKQIKSDYDVAIDKIDQNQSRIISNNAPTAATTTKPKLEIVEGWKATNDGSYSYIKGSIKNTGETNVQYWKLTAEFLDAKGSVLDTAYTNSLEIIRPGNQKEFEIMHQYRPEYINCRIFIEEIR